MLLLLLLSALCLLSALPPSSVAPPETVIRWLITTGVLSTTCLRWEFAWRTNTLGFSLPRVMSGIESQVGARCVYRQATTSMGTVIWLGSFRLGLYQSHHTTPHSTHTHTHKHTHARTERERDSRTSGQRLFLQQYRAFKPFRGVVSKT